MKDRLDETLRNYEIEPLQDACGIVGLLASQEDCYFDLGLAALTELQTRGYDGAGFTGLRSDNSIIIHKQKGTIREVFKPGIVQRLNKNSFYHGQYQVRYGTSGEYSSDNVQPFITRHKESNDIFVVSHNGQFSRNQKTQEGESDTYLFVRKLASSEGDDWDARITNTLVGSKGAWSLIIGVENSMYLARDQLGIRPLYFSQKLGEAGNYITLAASETEALFNAGFNEYHEVMPGQLLKFERGVAGYSGRQIICSTSQASCMFENVYTEDERSKALLPHRTQLEVNDSPSVADVRNRCGEELALEAPLTMDEVDFVVGIPGTAITGGEAFARTLNLPYVQAITDKNTPAFEERTFMQAQLEGILKKVQSHFNFDANRLANARIALIDDSIVRGNISQGLVQLLMQEYGVSEIHFRVLCPPIDKPCFLGINTRHQNELIAANNMREAHDYYDLVEKIRVQIGATSLSYLSVQGLLKAVSGTKNNTGFCLGCMVGRTPPIDQYGNVSVNI